MKKIRVGVVGLGWVAGAHIETFSHLDGVEVAAICSRRHLDGAELEAKYGIRPKVYRDYEAMLSDAEIDVIDICTPHPFHADQAVSAAQAGKHLIIEKPVALSYEDALRLRHAIKGAGVCACVCFEVRFSQQAQATRSLIEQGLLGDIHYAEVDYFHGIGPWYRQFDWNVKKEFGGSSLLTAGCHALDLLLHYVDAEVEEVMSYSGQSTNPVFAPYEYDTTSVTILKFVGGRIGKVASVVDCLQPYYFHAHLIGSQGSVLDNRFYSARLAGTSKDRWSTLGVPLVDSGDVSDHPYQPQFQAFIATIRDGGRRMPLTDFEDAFKTHRVIFAADRAAAEGRPVKLAELPE